MATQATEAKEPDQQARGLEFWKQGWALYEAQNYSDALPVFQQGAKCGNFDCYETLAYMYDNGLGVNSDHRRALEWYEAAGELGDKKAMGEIIFRYEEGFFDISADVEKAQYWKKKLKEAGG